MASWPSIVLDVEVATGETNEGDQLLPRLDATTATSGIAIRTVTADAGYAYAKIFGGLERRGIEGLILTKAEPIRSPVPLRRFRYDARHDRVVCPRGKVLRAGQPVKHGRFFHARPRDCSRCDLVALCVSKGRRAKSVVIGDDYPALLRAHRRRERWPTPTSGRRPRPSSRPRVACCCRSGSAPARARSPPRRRWASCARACS